MKIAKLTGNGALGVHLSGEIGLMIRMAVLIDRDSWAQLYAYLSGMKLRDMTRCIRVLSCVLSLISVIVFAGGISYTVDTGNRMNLLVWIRRVFTPNRMIRQFTYLILGLLALSAFAHAKPNFIIIFTDDQGYSDLSCFGGKHVYTPNIDQMAREGARLTSFYVAAPLCTPSRAALMTGCYPKRIDMDVPSSLEVKMKHLPAGKKFPVCLAGDGRGLNPNELTIAEVAQSVGYKTGMFGKWHLGDQPEFLPTRQGFEEYFGIPYSHDIHPKHKNNKVFQFPPLPLLEMEEVIELEPNANYLTRRITERAVDFIERNKDENFFLYVSHPLPHGPLAASPEIKQAYAAQLNETGKGKSGIFPSTIYEIDWSVGEILKTLKEQGIDENTIVLFTTDNGPAKGSAKPLRGKKGSTLEGGQRVPTVIRWPLGIAAGSDNDELLTAMDVLPTFAKLAGATLPDDLVIDGRDMMPTLIDGAESPHEYFFYAHWGVLEGVRWKSWKLRMVNGKVALYNLDQDISEQQNVAASHPEIVVQLKAAMQAWEVDMAGQVRPAGAVEHPSYLTKSNLD